MGGENQTFRTIFCAAQVFYVGVVKVNLGVGAGFGVVNGKVGRVQKKIQGNSFAFAGLYKNVAAWKIADMQPKVIAPNMMAQ